MVVAEPAEQSLLPQWLQWKTYVLHTVYSPLEFWKTHASSLPAWAVTAAQKVLLIQPTSAASERFFSLLNSSFSQQQYSSLQDYIETSLMLQYNKY